MSTTTATHMSFIDSNEHKSFVDAPFDSPFAYMDGGLEFFHYDHSPIGVNVGLPQQVAPSMDLNAMGPMDYHYASSSFAPSPPTHFMSQDEETGGVAPQALFSNYGLSSGELSDGMPSGRISRGSGSRSPAAVQYASVPRSQRFNPIAVPASRPSTRAQVAATHRRTKSSRSNDLDSDDDDDEEFKPSNGNPAEPSDNVPRDSASRREIVRKQRIESEQRRRDELRDGYNRLKDTLPSTNQKTSKVSLLDRATSHIRNIETQNLDLHNRLKSAEHEVHRLRAVNEALMLNRVNAQQQLAEQQAQLQQQQQQQQQFA